LPRPILGFDTIFVQCLQGEKWFKIFSTGTNGFGSSPPGHAGAPVAGEMEPAARCSLCFIVRWGLREVI
jgi:hypothetical protein